jgi:hypothetical protein
MVRATELGLDWAAAEALAEDELEQRLYGPRLATGTRRPLPDPVYIHQERKKTGVTLGERCPQADDVVAGPTLPVALVHHHEDAVAGLVQADTFVEVLVESAVEFDTIAKLARVQRMDLLIHLPTMDMKRNFGRGTEEKLTRAVGTDEWKKHAKGPNGIARWAVEALRTKLAEFGYTGTEVPSPRVTNTKNGGLYHLVFAAKHDLGDKIWKSIAKTTGTGQGSLL